MAVSVTGPRAINELELGGPVIPGTQTGHTVETTDNGGSD